MGSPSGGPFSFVSHDLCLHGAQMTSRSTKVIDSYNRYASHWQQLRSKSLFEKPWLDRFLGVLPQTPTILDLGCGNGDPIARYFLEQGASVTGVDGACAFIETAKNALPAANWFALDMRDLDLSQKFDGVIAWNSSFHLSPDEQRGMFKVFQSHTSPRAALMFTSGTEFGEVTGEFAGESIYYASLDNEEYRALLVEHGFSLIAHLEKDPSCGDHTIWLARRTG